MRHCAASAAAAAMGKFADRSIGFAYCSSARVLHAWETHRQFSVRWWRLQMRYLLWPNEIDAYRNGHKSHQNSEKQIPPAPSRRWEIAETCAPFEND